MKLTRRDTLTFAAAAAALGLAGVPSLARAADGDVIDITRLMNPAGVPDKVLGNPEAKVTLIEYASPTCPHCAAWSNDVLPAFKEKYVATGKVKFIIRPFARNTLDAAIFMLAEHAAKAFDAGTNVSTDPSAPSSEPSAEPAAPDPSNPSGYSQSAIEAYENVLATFFKTQGEWAVAADPLVALKKVTAQLGFSEEAFNLALTDQALFEGIDSMRKQAIDEFDLQGTPTFYLNGKTLGGEKSLDELSAEIDPLL